MKSVFGVSLVMEMCIRLVDGISEGALSIVVDIVETLSHIWHHAL